ncbi:ribonuclease H-like domain-containing protein [Patescibacteria group bacterium]|nr:ribonuclease H-like domain-containing protein [Patescibacteria group bacterium]
MSKEVVLDIETIGDIKKFDELKITVVSIYEYETDKYTSFEEHELSDLWPILEKAERTIGYNSEHFDMPILNKYYAGDLLSFPHLDLLKVIKDTNGKRYKLDDVAKATLENTVKSADGLEAMKWWEEGRKEDVKRYCEQDVKVTKEVYEYGRKNRMLYIQTLTGDLQPIGVNFEPKKEILGADGQVSETINLTLPF